MHKGRYGRRVQPPQLSLDATPPFWMPYYFRPGQTTFLFAGFPIVGPLAAPYHGCVVVHSAAACTWQHTWTDLVTGFTFASYLIQHPWHATPGVVVQYGINHPATGATLSGFVDVGPLGTYWDIIGNVGGTFHGPPPTIVTGLFASLAQPQDWHCASWHQMPV